MLSDFRLHGGDDEACTFVATTTAAIIAASIAAGGSATAAAVSSHASSKAAKAQAGAASEAARIQDEASKRAEAFARSQSENEFRNAEVARRGNYDIDAARQRRLSTLGGMIGMGPREIPAYVPGVDPGYDGTSAPGQATGGFSPTDPRVSEVLNRVTQGLAPTAENLPTVIKALNDAGIKATRATHAGGVASDDFINIGDSGGLDVIQNVGSPNAKWQQLPGGASAGGVGGGAPALRQLIRYRSPMAPALQAPSMARYAPQSLGSFIGGN